MIQRLRQTAVLCALCAAALLCGALPALAQVRQINLQEMVGAAGTIITGRVTDVRCAVDARGNTVTYTTFAVEQAMRGGGASSITITQYGGEVDGKGMYLAHVRYFSKGEHLMVMFFPSSKLGYTSIVGLNQAVWNVNADGTIELRAADVQGLPAAFLTRYKLNTSLKVSATTFGAMVSELGQGFKTNGPKPAKARKTATRSGRSTR